VKKATKEKALAIPLLSITHKPDRYPAAR